MSLVPLIPACHVGCASRCPLQLRGKASSEPMRRRRAHPDTGLETAWHPGGANAAAVTKDMNAATSPKRHTQPVRGTGAAASCKNPVPIGHHSKAKEAGQAPSSSWDSRGESCRCCLREAGPCTEDQELSEIWPEAASWRPRPGPAASLHSPRLEKCAAQPWACWASLASPVHGVGWWAVAWRRCASCHARGSC